MGIRTPFVENEWYHCYSRGIDKRAIFFDTRDYLRFKEILYLANSSRPFHRRDIPAALAHEDVFSLKRENLLTAVGAYALMPNHFHLLLREVREGGISAFMQKLGTAYTMYFNTKYTRSGGLLTGPFRSRHVYEDRYFQHIVGYIHMNPAELFEPGWKKGCVKNGLKALKQKLIAYPYSSFPLFAGEARPEATIVDASIFNVYINPPIARIVRDAYEYYKEFSADESPEARPRGTRERGRRNT